MLRFYRDYIRAYIDNIVIFSKILEEHANYLHAIFGLLNFKEITSLSKKSYLDYSTITLLDQKIDAFELIVVANKIAAIKKLNFSYNFTNLKLYLKLTEYFRDYILYYA